MFEAGSRISHTLQNGEANMLPIGSVASGGTSKTTRSGNSMKMDIEVSFD
jgi:hypothetical protein